MSKILTTASGDGATDTAKPTVEQQVTSAPSVIGKLRSNRRMRRIALAALAILVMLTVSVGYFFMREDAVPTPESGPSAMEQFDEQLALLQKSNESVARIDSFTIDDAMLQKLVSIDRLTTIQVEAESISLDTIVSIAKMPKLEQLHIRGAAIDDEMFAALAESTTIWLLNFPNANVSPAGLECLAKMPALRQLRLGINDGDNSHGRAVATLSRLRAVHLIRVAITDEGLHSLAKMPHLESLYLDDSSITDAGWTWLIEKSPQLHVHVNQQHHDRDPQSH